MTAITKYNAIAVIVHSNLPGLT